MKTFFIEDIYKKVLRETQFSITGHTNIDDILHSFFDKLSNSPFFTERGIDAHFLLGGILQLKNAETWEVEGFKEFYYRTFKEANKNRVLSFYFSILQKQGFNNTSKLLAEIFGTDIDFRIKLTNNNLNRSFVHYYPDERVFEVNIAKSIFKKEWLNVEDESLLKNLFYEKFDEIIGVDENNILATCSNRKAKINEETNRALDNALNEKYVKLFNAIYDPKKVEQVIKQLLPEFLTYIHDENYHLFIRYNDTKKQEDFFTKIIYAAIALAWLCLYYNCKIEYSMSVANVDDNPSEEKYKKNKNSHQHLRNLGGLIIGYNADYKLSLEDRVVLNIISDRITTVVAGNYQSKKIVDTEKKLEYITKKEKAEKVANYWSSINKKIPKKDYIGLIEDAEKWEETIFEINKQINHDSLNEFKNITFNASTNNLKDFLLRRRLFLYAFLLKDSNDKIEPLDFFYCKVTKKSIDNITDYKRLTDLSAKYNYTTWVGISQKKITNEYLLPEEIDWLKSHNYPE